MSIWPSAAHFYNNKIIIKRNHFHPHFSLFCNKHPFSPLKNHQRPCPWATTWTTTVFLWRTMIHKVRKEVYLLKIDINTLRPHPIPVIINDDDTDNNNGRMRGRTSLPQGKSMDSLPSTFTNGSSSPGPSSHCMLDQEIQPDELEEKARLISQVLELQNTLDDLSQRVNSVKEENLKLKSENSVLNQYVENLMSASSVFQSAAVNGTKKK